MTRCLGCSRAVENQDDLILRSFPSARAQSLLLRGPPWRTFSRASSSCLCDPNEVRSGVEAWKENEEEDFKQSEEGVGDWETFLAHPASCWCQHSWNT